MADGKTLNTAAIQAAIDECSANGGGNVVLTEGEYVCATILLKDNVTLEVKKAATLYGSKNIDDYDLVDAFVDATGQLRGKCLVGAIEAKNIGIIGEGTLEGNGEFFRPEWRPKGAKVHRTKEGAVDRSKDCISTFMVRLVRCEDITVKDVLMNQPGAWCVHLYECDGFLVDGLRIFSHANKNNDGVDIDSSCNGVIRNCDIHSGDDAICFKSTSPRACHDVHVYDCILSSGWGAIKFGTESMGDMRDIVVEDCYIHDTRGGGVKVLSADGANLSNIVVRNLVMRNVEMPIFVRLSERCRTYRDAKQRPVGSMKGVHISNIDAIVTSDVGVMRMTPGSAIVVSGTQDHMLEDVTIENVKVRLLGNGKKVDADRVMPENKDEYPEFTKLGVAPAYGLYVRNVKDFTYKNVTIDLVGKDARPEELFHNVTKVNKL